MRGLDPLGSYTQSALRSREDGDLREIRLEIITLKAFANLSPGRGPRAGSPRGVGAFALETLGKKCTFIRSQL